MPPLASSKRPFSRRLAPVNAPFSCPNSSFSISVSGMAAQLIATNGPCAARRQEMQAAREQLLAGAALAQQQHGGLRRRHPLEQAQRRLDARMAPDDPRAVAELERGHVALLTYPGVDQLEQVLDLDRFLEEVGGAQLHGLDRGADAAERREHHHRGRRLRPLGRAQKIEPRGFRQLEIGEDEVVGGGGEKLDSRGPVAGGVDVKALLGERGLDQPSQVLAVLDHQDAAAHQPAPWRAAATPTARDQVGVVAGLDRAQVEHQPAVLLVGHHRRLPLTQPREQRVVLRQDHRLGGDPELGGRATAEEALDHGDVAAQRRGRGAHPAAVRLGVGPHAIEQRCRTRQMVAQHQLEGRQRGAVRTQRAVERMPGAGPHRRFAPHQDPRLRSPQQLVAAAAGEIAPQRRELREAAVIAQLERRMRPQQATALVDQDGDAPAASEIDQRLDRHRLDEPGDAVVGREDLEQERGPGLDRRLVVGEPGAIGGADLDQLDARRLQDLRDAEGAADLDQLAARDHRPAPGGQRGEREQQRRGVVVDHQRRLGAGHRPQQAVDPAVAISAPAGLEVELEIAVGVEQRRQRLGDLRRQGRTAEVGVDQDAGGVEHPAQRSPQLAAEPRLDPARQRLERRLEVEVAAAPHRRYLRP